MKFSEVVAQTLAWLQREGRVSYRALRLEFDLKDDVLDALKEELIEVKQLAVDKDSKMLVWTGTPRAKPARSKERTKVKAPEPRIDLHAEAERRQLTVLFCDLVGSTPLAEKLDPEELRDVILAYQQTCAEQIRRFDGYIARYVGDGLLVYFGYPHAHEDDAQRAVRAGLGIVAEVPQLNARLQQAVGVLRESPLQVRIGVHTGLAVVGDIGEGGSRDRLAIVGETPNVAARVQGIGEANRVLISAATYRLVQGLFECEDRGPQELKGVSNRVAVYRVIRESEARSRFDVALRTGLAPLIGREHELGLLQQRWKRAQQGEGQVVLLSGEPGIGKSRLVQELKDQLAHEGVTRIEFRCSPYHQNSALYPIIEHLHRMLEFSREDAPAAKLEKLQHALRHYRFLQADTVPLLATLLSLPHPESSPPITVSPQKHKEKTHAALVAWLVEEAEQKTVYNTWEDLHWADPSTLEVLNLVVDQAPTASLYVLLTFRPEFTPPWGSRSHLSQIALSRLGRSEVEAMVEWITGGKALPPEVIQQIAVKTDGVPLFVEELTKTVVESGLVAAVNDHYELSGPLPPLAIPSTLHASLLARLDRLATKEIAQLGATIGRGFSYELLRAVSPLDEAMLQHGLKQLVEAELVYQRGLLPQAHYLFKHALIRDTAYQSLLKSSRQQYHRQIAQVLATRFPEIVETQPELVARHYTEAGLIERAIPYWQQAGDRATQRSAYVEAISHLTRGLEVLKGLADTPARVHQELTLQLALSYALLPSNGWAAAEVGKAGTRARELCQQLGETPQLFPVLFRLIEFYNNRAEFQTLRELAEQLMRLAQSVQDPYPLSIAHLALGVTLYQLGELPSARLHVEQAIALYDPQQHRRPTSTTVEPAMEGQTPERAPWLSYRWASNTADPRIECLAYASWTLVFLGYPDQALKRSHELLAFAEGLSQPYGLAYASMVATSVHLFRREGPLARERAEALMALSTEQGYPFWLAWGTMMRGGALAQQGQVEEGIAELRQGLAAYRAMGAELGLAWFLTMLAGAHGQGGQVEEGLTLLVEALALVDKTGGRLSEAGLYVTKGWLLLARSGENQAEAEACFCHALEVAGRQSAKWFELPAVMSLSRLWQRLGKKDEARQMLAGVYGWFTEGFDTAALKDAKALLDALSS
jgi:class 3 adenylate cyclase/predicted ATPase